MQRIETEFAGRPLTLETGRLAKQAAGSAPRAVRRHGGARGGDRLPQHLHPPVLPAHRRVPREDLRRGQDPGRVPQARGPAVRQGDPGRPAHRPLDPAALPRGLQERSPGLRHRALGRPGERRRRARRRWRPRRRSRSRRCRGTVRSPRCGWAGSRATGSSTRPSSSSSSPTIDLVGQRLRRLDRHGRGRRARDLRERNARRAQGGPEGHQGAGRAARRS